MLFDLCKHLWTIFAKEFCKITESKLRVFLSYWNLYASDTKGNSFFKVIKIFTESVKIRFIQWKHSKAEQKYFQVSNGQNDKYLRVAHSSSFEQWAKVLHLGVSNSV